MVTSGALRSFGLGLLAAVLACQRDPGPPRHEHALTVTSVESAPTGSAMPLSRFLRGAEGGSPSNAPASSLVAASGSGGRATPRAAPKLGPTARKIALEPSQLAEIFATIPQLASTLPSIRYFVEPDDTAAVVRRAKTTQGAPDTEGFTLTTSPLLWNPAPGEEVIVVLGHGAKDSFVVALYRLADNKYRLASSLLLANDLGPFALAYHPDVRERLLWSSCWKCPGEGGAISFRDGRRVIIVQQ